MIVVEFSKQNRPIYQYFPDVLLHNFKQKGHRKSVRCPFGRCDGKFKTANGP